MGKQKSLWWLGSSLCSSLNSNYSSPQSIPASPSQPGLRNASLFLPQGINPCSLLCLECLSPRRICQLSPFEAWAGRPSQTSLDKIALYSQCSQALSADFSLSTYSLSVMCYKLPIYLTYYLSFHQHINSKKCCPICSLFHSLCLEQCHKDKRYFGASQTRALSFVANF